MTIADWRVTRTLNDAFPYRAEARFRYLFNLFPGDWISNGVFETKDDAEKAAKRLANSLIEPEVAAEGRVTSDNS